MEYNVKRERCLIMNLVLLTDRVKQLCSPWSFLRETGEELPDYVLYDYNPTKSGHKSTLVST